MKGAMLNMLLSLKTLLLFYYYYLFAIKRVINTNTLDTICNHEIHM